MIAETVGSAVRTDELTANFYFTSGPHSGPYRLMPSKQILILPGLTEIARVRPRHRHWEFRDGEQHD